jgi:uncharacterized protein (UPF0261 family)
VSKKIAIIGTLDTKGEQIKYIKGQIEGRGYQAIVIDAGVLGEVPFEPDISRKQVAEASGLSLEEISGISKRPIWIYSFFIN